MSIRNLLIIVLIIVVSGLFSCNKGKNREYELKGKVTMKNDCTKNNVDLPKKIRIKAKLHYQRSTVNPSSFNKGDIATAVAVVDAKTKDATYSLKETTSEIAKEWKIEAIVRNDGSEICKPIACKSPLVPLVCRDNATVERNRFTVPIPSGQTIVTRDYRIQCSCVERK
jgi:hypothetical protein